MKEVAIILAAGMGTRLRPETDTVPKCLVEVFGQPILEYQLCMLESAGVNRVIIVAGYLSERVAEFIHSRNSSAHVEVVVNQEYAITNNMASLGMALSRLDCASSAVYVLNGDVVFESGYLAHRPFRGTRSAVFVDRTVFAEESMKIGLGPDGLVKTIAKAIAEPDAYGVSVDMYRFVPSDVVALRAEIERFTRDESPNQWMEVAIQNLINQSHLALEATDRSGLVWWEIDNEEDKARAALRLSMLQDCGRLREVRLLSFDLDGTLLTGAKPLPGSREIIEQARAAGISTAFVTNNSSMVSQQHSARLADVLGVEVEPSEVYTSIDELKVMVDYGTIRGSYVLLPPDVRRELGVLDLPSDQCSTVIVGFDTSITYGRLAEACKMIQRGVPWILVHPDIRCPNADGFVPDAGSIGRLIEDVTRTKPSMVCGKPSAQMLLQICEQLGVGAPETAYVGDRLYTDMKMAENAGATGILVLTGDTTLWDVVRSRGIPERGSRAPYYVVPNLRYLLAFLEAHKVLTQ